jgi:hypothetical protein
MPLLGDEGMQTRGVTGSNFTFQATRLDRLKSYEYTLTSVAVDTTSSVDGFADQLRDMLVKVTEACQASPRSNNLLSRAVEFSTAVGGVREIHGFKLLRDIDTDDYPQLRPAGFTPLVDAAYNSIGAMIDYGHDLVANDYLVNGIVFVITDGYDNASKMTPGMIKTQLERIRREEQLESIVSVLVGINATQYRTQLEDFKAAAGFDHYIDAGDATPGRLAKLAAFVSQSISSQSQALGSNGPSKAISATI